MATDKAYLTLVLDSLSGMEDISYRPMMGEYLLYYRGKVVGGLYDNRLLVKPTATALAALPDAVFETPYPGGKDMLMFPDVDDRDRLQAMIRAVYDGLKP